jgi:DNA replicative helicase MCM subunit Mcm2 (Cdc46/Mcm family)
MNEQHSTEVADEELLKKYLPTYINAPEDLEQARDRIIDIEMTLEDLARAAEIAQITGSWEILQSFVETATEKLKTKIQIVQPDQGDVKLNVVIDDREPNNNA